MTAPTKANQQLDELIKRCAESHRELSPPRDLWRGIETSIQRQQLTTTTHRTSIWAWLSVTAATLLVGVGVYMSLAAGLYHDPNATDAGASPTAKLIAYVTEHHQAQRQILLANYQDAGLTPNFVELENELQQLRHAAEQVTQQLQQEPENSELWQFLQWLHQQELELLKTMYLQPRSYQQAGVLL